MTVIPANPGFYSAFLLWNAEESHWDLHKQPILGWIITDKYDPNDDYRPPRERNLSRVTPTPLILDPIDTQQAIITPDGVVHMTDGSGSFDHESLWLEAADKMGLGYNEIPRE